MSSAGKIKKRLFLVLFAWPVAVMLGCAVGRLTDTHSATAFFAIAWLGLLYWTMRCYADRERWESSAV